MEALTEARLEMRLKPRTREYVTVLQTCASTDWRDGRQERVVETGKDTGHEARQDEVKLEWVTVAGMRLRRSNDADGDDVLARSCAEGWWLFRMRGR